VAFPRAATKATTRRRTSPHQYMLQYSPSAITWSSNVSKMYTPMVEIIRKLRTSEHGGGKALNEALEALVASTIRKFGYPDQFCARCTYRKQALHLRWWQAYSQHDFCPRFGSTSAAVLGVRQCVCRKDSEETMPVSQSRRGAWHSET
jgi:hypothetical protein